MAKHRTGQGRNQARGHQRPDGAREVADQEHCDQAGDLRHKLDQHHTLLLESSYSDIYLCRLESENDRRYAGYGQH
ncbi:hypothetical protein D3C77_679930 [compost metagenome]